MLSKSNLWRALIILVLLALFVTPFSTSGRALASQNQQSEGLAENGAGIKPLVSTAVYSDTSPALRDMKPVEAAPSSNREIPFRVLPKAIGKGMKAEQSKPAVVQNKPVEPNMPAYIANFEGVPNVDGVLPPDTNGDIGVDPGTGTKYYMQWNNLSFQIWDVTNPAAPVSLYGPVTGNTLFSGFGGPCQTTNHGDPIVLFDHLANRWLASQFSVSGPFYQCIAISQTADPTGAWYRYAFLYSNSLMNDYPKFGVWPDGYYMTANQFDPYWAGAGVVAFERDAMLVGNPGARMVYFNLGAVTENYGGMLPADLDGPPPPAGTPNFFAEWDDSSWLGDPADTLRIWEFDVDWANPANSTFGLNASYDANFEIPTSDVDPNMCAYERNCIPQPGGTAVDAISDRLMNRLQYRNYGSYQSLVTNHTVDVDDSDHAGMHWLELHDSGSGWDLYQDGVYAPDSAHRWMGSAALDASGNLALGYSVSSTSVYPSIRYTGRLVSDPLDTLPQGEAVLIAGSGYQQHSAGRWGDYSMMGVDPVDQCTFWYTQEYYAINGSAPWQTRIGSFKYPTCTLGPTGTLEGTVTDSATSDPIEGVKVSLGGGLMTYTDAAGFYQLTNIPVGSYFVTASKFGYVTQTYSGVDIDESNTTVQDFLLDPAAMVTVEGTVTDGSGHLGMPLYARLDISGYPYTPLFTDPASGYYILELPEGETFTFTVNAMSPGYNPEVRDVTPVTGGNVEDFALTVDLAVCNAPGYGLPGYMEPFDSGIVPAGWTTIDHTGGGDWAFNDPGGKGNLTGGSGLFAVVDSDYYGAGYTQDAELISPPMDFSGRATVQVEFDTDFNYYDFSLDEVADVDVSLDDGASWTNVWRKTGGDYRGPKHEVVNITALAAGEPEVFVRFHYYNAEFEWWWQVDNAYAGAPPVCQVIPGGLLVGNVYSENTGEALNEALVTSNGAPDSATTGTTPDDPNLDDGFYLLFSTLTGVQPFTASKSEYGSQTATPTVLANETVRQDFNLPAGILGAAPPSFTVTLEQDQTAERTLTLSNTGGYEASFEIVEANTPPVLYEPDGPFADAGRHLGPKRLNDRDSRGVLIYNPPAADPLEAGDVLDTWSTGLVYPWGDGFNTLADDLWVGDLLAAGGDGFNHRYLPDGTDTGDAIDTAPWVGAWGADMAYNPLSGMLWQVNVGGDNCIYEMDPVAKVATGDKICPAFPTSERGLAFDPVSNTFYSGSWNDWVIYHFDSDGTMLDSVDVGLDISGLAFNPMTGSLFVMTNSDFGYDVYVLDVNDNYNVVGGFDIDGLGGFEQAGLEIDCSGTLWAVNQITQNVIAATSGESGVCAWQSIPWLTEAPESGTVAAGEEQNVTLTFDATGLVPGTYEAHLRIVENTPYEAPVVPVTLIVTAPQADLAVSLEGEPDPVAPGELLTYTVTVTNAGPDTAEGVKVKLPLPAAVTLISVTPSQGSCSALPCNLGSLASGGDATVTVVVQVKESASGNLTATAQVSATTADPEPGNNSDTVIISVSDAFYQLFLPLIQKAGRPVPGGK